MNRVPEVKEIVQSLLDKFDRSLSSTGQNKVNQSFVFKIDADSFPGYLRPKNNDEQDCALAVLNTLAQQSFLQVEKNFSGYFDKVVLKTNPDDIAAARDFLGEEDPKAVAQHYHELFSSLANDPDPVVSAFAQTMMTQTKDHRHLKGTIAYFDDENTLYDILKAIRAIDQLDSEVRERNFSIAHFGDSKYFAKIQPKVDRVFRDFAEQEFDEKDKPSRVLGVVPNPTFAMAKNGLIFKMGGEVIDLSRIDSPFPLFDLMIKEMQVVGLNVKRVVTIENETTFFDYQDPEALIIYLAGFHNRIRRDLLQKIYAFAPSIPYWHWSDIDAGGFYITNHLIEDTGIPFKPFRMGVPELQKYEAYCKPLEKNDIKRLTDQLASPKMSAFHETIRYMLEKKIKLEQEAFSTL